MIVMNWKGLQRSWHGLFQVTVPEFVAKNWRNAREMFCHYIKWRDTNQEPPAVSHMPYRI